MAKPIVEILDFHTAPDELKALSQHGGDEDYIVIIRDPDFDGGEAIDEHGDKYERGFGYFPFDNGFLARWFWERFEYNGEIIWIGAHS